MRARSRHLRRAPAVHVAFPVLWRNPDAGNHARSKPPMNIADFVDPVIAFVKTHQQWAAPVAFLLAFGESLAFLSLIIPSTVILVAISGLLGASGVSFWPVWLAAGVGGSLGYAVSYWVGLYFKDDMERIWPFSNRPDLIPKGRAFFERYGALGVFFGHFFGPVRAVIPVVAGMYAMPQISFQIANVLSAFLWAGGVLAPGVFALPMLIK
jgi:membrane protein DedA with SNARE-associated domain